MIALLVCCEGAVHVTVATVGPMLDTRSDAGGLGFGATIEITMTIYDISNQ